MANNDPTLQDIFNMLSASKTPTTQNPDLAEMYKKIHDVQDPIGAYDRASSIPGYAFGPNGLFAGQTPQSREAAMINHTGAYAPTQPALNRQNFNASSGAAAGTPLDILMQQNNAPHATAAQSVPGLSPDATTILGMAGKAGTGQKGLADLMKALLYKDKQNTPAYAQ